MVQSFQNQINKTLKYSLSICLQFPGIKYLVFENLL